MKFSLLPYRLLLVAILTAIFQIPLFSQEVSGDSKNIITTELVFTENKGQVSDQHNRPRPDVLFYGQAGGLVYHLRENGISYQFMHMDMKERADDMYRDELPGMSMEIDSVTIHRTDINWIGANKNMRIEKGSAGSYLKNYYLAVCPEGITGVESYNEITFKELFAGIDLHWYENKGMLEYDYIIHPGADPRSIKWEIEGAESIKINEKGELVILTPLGEIREQAPKAYQGENRVKVKWSLKENQVGFDIGKFDHRKTLIIDPIVSSKLWGTYYGGNGNDFGNYTVLGPDKFLYMAGRTESSNAIATAGSHKSSFTGGPVDAFLAKFDTNGTLIWATYYGGTAIDDGYACAIDASLNVYLAGQTNSNTTISTPGSFQPTYAGGGTNDAFLVKFNNNGVRQWGTYFGGPQWDFGQVCVTDAASNVYLIGMTYSPTGIATSGSHQSVKGLVNDGFVAKFDGNGNRLWATYYGGEDGEYIHRATVDASANLYLVGYTGSTTNISTPGSFQPSLAGGNDAFLVKMDSSGTRQWGTYFGGANNERSFGVSVAMSGNIYLTGNTTSGVGISTPGSYQPSLAGSTDGFLARFDNSGNRVWATYFGGIDEESSRGCYVAGFENVYFWGYSYSSSGIASYGNDVTRGGNFDGFVANFDSAGIFNWGSYYGGASEDFIESMTKDNTSGSIYITGGTSSSSSIATPGTHQALQGAGYDHFIIKIRECRLDTLSITAKVCDSYESPSGNHTWTTSGLYKDTLVNNVGCDSVINISLTVNSTFVAFSDTACKFYISPSGLHTWTVPGIYNDTLPNAAGCDSIITINLELLAPNTQVLQTGHILTSQHALAAYRWLDCDSGFAQVSGATSQGFVATKNGHYAVEVTANGCVDTSACYTVTTVGLVQNDRSPAQVYVYPNPGNGQLTVDFGEIKDEVVLTLINIQGQFIRSWKFAGIPKTTLETGMPAGTYFLEIRSGDQQQSFPVVIE